MDETNPVYTGWSDEQLREAADGCTEWTCPYHGAYNRELADRRKRKEQDEM